MIGLKHLTVFVFAMVVAAASVSAVHPISNNPNLQTPILQATTNTYRCPPCGCLNDKLNFAADGTCSECNMHLVRSTTGFAVSLDERLMPLLASNALGLVYPKVIYPLFASGILIAIFLLIASARGKSLNVFLTGIILTISLYGFKNQLYGVNYRMTDTYKSLFIPLSFILLIGPLIYYYVKSLLVTAFKWKKVDLLHFVPAVIAFFSYGILLIMNEEVKTHFMFSPFEVSFSHFEQSIAVLSGLLYVMSSIRVVNQHIHSTSKVNIQILWAKRFLIGMSLMLGIWGTLIFLNYWLYDFGVATVTYNPLWVLLGLVLLWIGIEVVSNLKFFLISRQFGFNGNGAVPDQTLIKYRLDLERLMSEGKLYTNPGISLDDIAKQLGINPRYLSLVLNNAVGKNFYDFINQYRVAEVKEMLRNPKNRNLTIEAISFKAGFKSKSSFNTAFKKNTGMTPKEFMSQFPVLHEA